MGLTSNTGLLAAKQTAGKIKVENESIVQLRCEVTPAPFMLRPYAGLYNPFPNSCSVLCNHPADTEAKEYVKRAKDAWALDGKNHSFHEDLAKFHDAHDKDKIRTPHDIVTEDMFRRYTETDSRPLTPAPTLASGKSRGSRRCLTPDQPHTRTAIVLDLRRSHSQETLYYHGYTTSEMTVGHTTSATNDRSTLPSLNLSEAAHNRLIKGQCEQLPPLASPLVLSKRAERPPKEQLSVRTVKKLPVKRTLSMTHTLLESRTMPASRTLPESRAWPENSMLPESLTLPVNRKMPVTGKLPVNTDDLSRWSRVQFILHANTSVIKKQKASPGKRSRSHRSPSTSRTPIKLKKVKRRASSTSSGHRSRLTPTSSSSSKKSLKTKIQRSPNKNQLKALNLNKPTKGKGKSGDAPASQRSKGDKAEKEANDGSEASLANMDDGGSGERRRGKRRRKGRQGGSDRLTSAGLAAQTQQDPETQIAGIGTDSHNPSSRGSIAQAIDDDVIILPVIKAPTARKTDSFLDDEILKYLHREVDVDTIETEFDAKRRYVFEEAWRTRPERPYGQEMQNLLKDFKIPAVSLGDWLHIPRVFSRQNAQFTLPIDSNMLESLTPMQYASRFVSIKKSKQLLYLTVLRKFRPDGYRMPIKNIEEGLVLMMGGILSVNQASDFRRVMDWDNYVEEENIPDEIKLTLLDTGYRRQNTIEGGDTGEIDNNTLKYRTWCGLCAICERMYGRFAHRDKDPPDGMELSDFTMIETKLATLKVDSGLIEILNAIRTQ